MPLLGQRQAIESGIAKVMNVRRFLLCILAICLLAGGAYAADATAIPDRIDFNRDVRPILSDNCYFCHGPDRNKRKADLRLDTKDGIFSHIKDAITVVPGKPDQSELFRRVTASDPSERMPDPKSNKRLSDHDIATLKKWIEQGAPWQGQWAYLKPVRPPVPDVKEKGFVRNPIDSFIAAKLEEAGLHPAPSADRATLIRRLSFDLTGLPPTPAEVEQFQKDQSPDAYDKLVDRLLASPHFGERMAVFWLDIVRYADTIGYHSDNPMNVWPYRDYVINSFNSNKGFDQFTIEQLAGDLLPNPTTEQKVASAYNRLLQTTEEGGAQPKEYRAKYDADRVRNVSTAWLGSTMGCCQCHDHKFDPFTQVDFYSMAAFFADVKEADVGRREAGMPVLDAKQESELKKIESTIADAKETLENDTPELAAAQQKWESEQSQQITWQLLAPDTFSVKGTSVLREQADDVLADSGKPAGKETFSISAHTRLKGITGFRLEALDDASLPAHGPGTAPNGNFVLTRFAASVVKENAKPTLIGFSRAVADHEQEKFSVTDTIKEKGATGWAILPETGKSHVAVFETSQPIGAEGGSIFLFSLQFRSQFPQHNIGRFRLSVTTSPNPASAFLPEKVKSALAIAADQRTEAQKKDLGEYFRSITPLLQPARQKLTTLEKKKTEFLDAAPKCLVTVEAPPRTVRLLHRGNWMDDTGAVMSPAVPAFLTPESLRETEKTRRLTRLDLAHWIVSQDNPLTARVFVNRLWRMYFGQGISKVLDDVGSQGEWPTHPKLIDWMAMEFMEPSFDARGCHPWDIKHIVRLLVTSSVYRESSKPSELDKEKDPYNRLLAHQARFRLDAEFVRDNALEISGLLVDHLGGPSVKPYQPPGYWDQLNFPVRKYVADTGPNQYRRGLYTWWQRSFLQPSLLAFDAPSREEAVCERNRSNIPQQALVLLNDPTYVEASRVFAAKIIQQGGDSVQSRLEFAYMTAEARKPRADEVRLLSNLLDQHLAEYQKDPAAAQKLIHAGEAPVPDKIDPAELAAWTSVARVIMNLHETITRM